MEAGSWRFGLSSIRITKREEHEAKGGSVTEGIDEVLKNMCHHTRKKNGKRTRPVWSCFGDVMKKREGGLFSCADEGL